MNLTAIIKKIAKPLIALLFWIGVWWLAALVIGKSVILPDPLTVAETLGDMLGTGEFYLTCLRSVGGIFAGLLIGMIVGTLLAIVTGAVKFLDVLFSPAIEAVKATPVASVIIVLLFVMTKSIVPMLAAALMVIPILFMNVRKGVSSVSKDKLEVAKIYDFSAKKYLKYVYMPSVIPYFSAGCKSALGLAWKAGVAAEVICTPNSTIGTMLYNSKVYLESERLFAWTIVVVVLSFIIEKLLIWLLSKALKGGDAV